MPDRYEIKGKIARGGIGAIYRAFDTVMGREVAIKRLLPLEETHLNESAEESLTREAAALARFQHPNVVTIYAFEEDSEGRFVVMEFVDGETLKETVTKAALPVEDFVDLTLQILDPLVAARDLNLLHRDIKPSNIMITWLATGRIQIKMLDFGLAKFSQKPSTQTLDQTGSFLGSIDYLAPEQLDLQKLDQRTDLYSLGCVLYYCLTQTPPFEGKNAAETMRNHLSHKVVPIQELRPDVPPAMAKWLMRLISRYPNQRPGDAGVALSDFQEAVKEKKGEKTPVATTTPPSSETSKGKEEPPRKVATLTDEPPGAASEKSGPKPLQLKTAGRSEKTGPKLKTGEPKGKSGPQLLVPAKGGAEEEKPSIKVGEAPKSQGARAPRHSVRPEDKFSAKRGGGFSGSWVILILLMIVVGILAAVVIQRSLNRVDSVAEWEKRPRPEARADSNSDQSPMNKGGKPAAKGKGAGKKRQARNPEANAATLSPDLPITADLVGHYAASDFAFGKDLRKPAEPGQAVLAWANLAPETHADHLLVSATGKEADSPKLKKVTPANYPELNGPQTVIDFSETSLLQAQGSEAVSRAMQARDFTCVIVVRPSVDQAPMVRFKTPTQNSAMTLAVNPKGYSATVLQGKTRKTVMAKAPVTSTFAIVSLVWKAEERSHQVFVSLPDGESEASQAMKTTAKLQLIDGYRIGQRKTPNTVANAKLFSGLVAEWVIYGKALPESDRKELEDHFRQRYFAK